MRSKASVSERRYAACLRRTTGAAGLRSTSRANVPRCFRCGAALPPLLRARPRPFGLLARSRASSSILALRWPSCALDRRLTTSGLAGGSIRVGGGAARSLGSSRWMVNAPRSIHSPGSTEERSLMTSATQRPPCSRCSPPPAAACRDPAGTRPSPERSSGRPGALSHRTSTGRGSVSSHADSSTWRKLDPVAHAARTRRRASVGPRSPTSIRKPSADT